VINAQLTIQIIKDIHDAVVVEGPKAGGHMGFKEDQIDDPDFVLDRILPDVVAVVKSYEDKFRRTIPVIAAGGVFTGTDIYNFCSIGFTPRKFETGLAKEIENLDGFDLSKDLKSLL